MKSRLIRDLFKVWRICYAKNSTSHFFADVRNTMLAEASAQFEFAELDRLGRYHQEGAAVISELLKKGSISKQEYYDIAGRHLGSELLETNVFALHVDSRVTFQSTLMRRFCEQESALWEEKKVKG